jgi:hypothetical protein
LCTLERAEIQRGKWGAWYGAGAGNSGFYVWMEDVKFDIMKKEVASSPLPLGFSAFPEDGDDEM